MAVMEAKSPTSHLCLLRAGVSYVSLLSMFSWFLHRQPQIFPEAEVYLSPDESRTVFNPLCDRFPTEEDPQFLTDDTSARSKISLFHHPPLGKQCQMLKVPPP